MRPILLWRLELSFTKLSSSSCPSLFALRRDSLVTLFYNPFRYVVCWLTLSERMPDTAIQSLSSYRHYPAVFCMQFCAAILAGRLYDRVHVHNPEHNTAVILVIPTIPSPLSEFGIILKRQGEPFDDHLPLSNSFCTSGRYTGPNYT